MPTISTTSGQQVRLRRERVLSQISKAARLHLLTSSSLDQAAASLGISFTHLEPFLSFLFFEGAKICKLRCLVIDVDATSCQVRDVRMQGFRVLHSKGAVSLRPALGQACCWDKKAVSRHSPSATASSSSCWPQMGWGT